MPTLIHDTFTAEDGTLLTARTPDVNTPGAPWLVTRGTIYSEDQPPRWAAFRNLLVFTGVHGNEVLGGKPVRLT